MHQPIAIIGAGIGGLTTALAFKQRGLKVAIFESAAAIKPLGAGIVLAGNAMQIFEELGIRERIEHAGNKISFLKMTDEKFNLLSVVPLAKLEKKYGVSNIAIHRADLQGILAKEVGYDNIHLAKRLVKISKGEQTTLTFEDNSVRKADITIGADGIHSIVRNQLFGPVTIRDTAQICWRGVLNTEIAEKYPQEAYEAWGRGKRFGFVKISHNRLYWFAVVNAGMEMNTSLPDLFEEFHPDVLKIISGTDKEQIYENLLQDLTPFSGWHRGKVCLMGDAAHATTPNLGQGACQAVEDAYILAKLFGSGKPIETIFAEYEKYRKKKAHFIVNTSRMIGKLPHIENEIAVWLRNLSMRMIPEILSVRQIDKVFDIEKLLRDRK